MNEYSPELQQFIGLAEGLMGVKIYNIHFPSTNNAILLYTDSKYKGLDVIQVPVTDGVTNFQKHIEWLKSHALTYAKDYIRHYWIENNQNLNKNLFNTMTHRLLELVFNDNVSVKDFEKAIERKHWYRSPFAFIKDEIKAIKPIFPIKGKKKVVEKNLVVKPENIPARIRYETRLLEEAERAQETKRIIDENWLNMIARLESELGFPEELPEKPPYF